MCSYECSVYYCSPSLAFPRQAVDVASIGRKIGIEPDPGPSSVECSLLRNAKKDFLDELPVI